MRISRKKLAIVASVLVSLVVAGTAFAFWSATGSGTGTASAGSAGTLTLHASASNMYPGATQDVAITADNSGDSALKIAKVHLDSVAADGGHSACVVADFTMLDVTVNAEVAGHASGAAVGTGHLAMADTGISQNACQGATLTLTLSSTAA